MQTHIGSHNNKLILASFNFDCHWGFEYDSTGMPTLGVVLCVGGGPSFYSERHRGLVRGVNHQTMLGHNGPFGFGPWCKNVFVLLPTGGLSLLGCQVRVGCVGNPSPALRVYLRRCCVIFWDPATSSVGSAIGSGELRLVNQRGTIRITLI